MSGFGLVTACLLPSRFIYSLGTHTLNYLTRLNRFTCVAAYQLRSLGSAAVVTFPSARFSTRLLFRDYLGGATIVSHDMNGPRWLARTSSRTYR